LLCMYIVVVAESALMATLFNGTRKLIRAHSTLIVYASGIERTPKRRKHNEVFGVFFFGESVQIL
jgi:hypothetical protein